MPNPKDELPELPQHLADMLVKRDTPVPSIKQIDNMEFPRAIAPGFTAEGDRIYQTVDETTTPAGIIVGVDYGVKDPAVIVMGEPVEESNTQRLRRMLAEDFGPSSDEGCWQITEDRLNDIRELAARIETNYAVYLLQYVLQTVFNDEIKRNRLFLGKVGSKVAIREELLEKLGKGITDLIEACEQAK